MKACIIGTGFVGNAHIEAMRRLGFIEIAALVESNGQAAREKANAMGIPLAYGDYREMLLNPEIQVVHNCTPNHLHYQINKDIILAGKHVLSEKPLAVTSSQSAELLDLARKHGVVHGVNFNYRQYAIMEQLAFMIKSGEMGDIRLIHGDYLQDWLSRETDYNWRMSPEIGGRSRAVADIGSHWCDIVQYVTGKKIVQVCADLATVIPVRKKAKGHADMYPHGSMDTSNYEDVPVHTEDYASVLLRFDDGAKGVFTVSQVSHGRKNRLAFELDGRKKSAYWNQEEPDRLWVGHRDRANEILLSDPSLLSEKARQSSHYPGGHVEGWPDGLKNMMIHYYNYILANKNPVTDAPDFATFEDGHHSMCIIEAILASHEQERWVTVNYSGGGIEGLEPGGSG
ncbi:MAG: afr 3 [Paenibacillaceae bacterium]|jgi:predicted dehydrogenase|nr:afr 3 [Paenibacillaceae bacterium]